MKTSSIQKLHSLIIIMCASVLTFAQPANDDCSTPTLLVVGADAASCTPVAGDTRGTVDATTVAGPEVCSASWYTDDVWFSFETGATPPQFGVTVEVRLDANNATELMEQGMAIYLDCETTSEPIDCFSDVAGRRTITFPPQCLDPNSSYLIRLWSAPEPIINAGTFSICAYEAQEITPVDTDVVIYEETFDNGLGAWTSEAETENSDLMGNILPDNWIWSGTGCIPGTFGGSECLTQLEVACINVGVAAMPAGWIQSGYGYTGGLYVPPFHDIRSYLVSPSIDLSNNSCVNLSWDEAHRGLNGNGARSQTGPIVEYSIDGGKTWSNPSTAINSPDVSSNYGGQYVTNGPASNDLRRQIPLNGAEGNSDVRIRFGFEGDFYFWIIDNIRVIEGTVADITAQANFFARAPINPMSIHQVSGYDFLIDIVNLACADQTNVNVNVTGVNSAGAEVHNVDLAYGDIKSDSLAQNVPFAKPFTPSTDVDTYTFTYTASSDLDEDLSNNQRSFTAEVVDEMMFRKEDGTATGAIGPNTDAFFVEGEPFNWEMGNIFYAPNATSLSGESLEFTTVSFQLDNPEIFVDERLNVRLYKIRDLDFDGIISKDDATEISLVGNAEYTVTGTENSLITVDLFPFGGGLDIEPQTHYMAAIESNLGPSSQATLNGIAMNFASNDSYDYSAAIFNARQNANGDLTRIRYAHAFAITSEGYFRITPSTTGDLTTGNFPENATPLIRLGFDIKIDNSTIQVNNDIDINIAPNPASTYITVDLSIEEATDMEVSIVNLTGQIIMTKSFSDVTELRENFDVSRLADGIYMIHIDTRNGIQTEKFVVSR